MTQKKPKPRNEKLFEDMTFDERLDHIEECQTEAARCIRRGDPSQLADIAVHIDYWGPWMLGELRRIKREKAEK